MSMDRSRATQLSLFASDLAQDGISPLSPHEKVYAAAFRKLYYHLYSNSRASRAERIISDLSNLLLCKIVSERDGGTAELEQFLGGTGTANELLLPILLKAFPHLISEDEKFSLEDDALRYGLQELAPLSFQTAPAHILGEAFQALIGPRLRGDKGQFFTPKSLVKAMVAILNPPFGAKVVDPACGTGGFLVETHAFQTGDGQPPDNAGKLIGMDKDRDLCRLSEAILEIAAPKRAIVLNVNSLDLAALVKLPAEVSPLEAGFVLTNPPFGAKIKIDDKFILRQYALGHKWSQSEAGWQQESGLRDAQDPQILFLELCIRLLRPGGQMGIVLPEGVFGNYSLGYVWDFVRTQGQVTTLLDCPRTTFQPSTDTKTNVLFFLKGDRPRPVHPPHPAERIWTAVALNCGHDRRGKNVRTTGEPYPDDFQDIGAGFAARESGSRFWQLATIADPYYLVPRYYDTAPIHELGREASRLGAELISLGEMVKRGYLRIRKGHEVGAEVYGTGDIPFVRTSDISNYEIAIDPTRSVSEEIYQQYADQQKLTPGDILLVSDGRYRIGRTAILHDYNYRCVVQSHIRIITVTRRSPISATELLYLLNLPMVQHQIRNLVFIQSTLGALGKRLYEIRVPLPKPTTEWAKTIEEFQSLIRGRAALLERLRGFEHPGYEL
jgi:type I restriction enzyme M protein